MDDASTGPWHRLTMTPFLDYHSPEPMRDSRSKPKVGFQFNVWKWPVLESSGGSLPQKSHLDAMPYDDIGGRKSVGGAYTSITGSRKKGNHGGYHSLSNTVFICCVG